MKWDGEWHITYEVFRDLGVAFAVVLVIIYILVVAWFRSFVTPLVIMAPIPLTLVGILPGHWLFGAFFTATSMIGFIALAGIVVRNSILLVDFVEQEWKAGDLKQALILQRARTLPAHCAHRGGGSRGIVRHALRPDLPGPCHRHDVRRGGRHGPDPCRRPPALL